MPLTLSDFTQGVVSYGTQIMISAARLAHVQDGASVLTPSGYVMSRYTNIPTGTAREAVETTITGITTSVPGTNAQLAAAVTALQGADLTNVTAVAVAGTALLDATPETVTGLLQTYVNAIQTAAPVDALTLLFGLANSISITSNSQSFSRASTATYLNTMGIIESVAANVLRQDAFSQLAGPQNLVRNSTNTGVIAGTPGILPTNWQLSTTTGLTVRIIGSGMVNGLPYMDVQYAGTASAGTGRISLFPDQISVVAGQVYTSSFSAQVIAGSTAQIYATLYEFDVNGNPVGNVSSPFTATGTLTRYTATATMPATAVSLAMAMEVNEQIGAPINVTVRFAGTQLQLGSAATTFIPTPVVRNPLPLIENPSTNLITWSAAIGGSNWSKIASVTTVNAAIAPDGTATASHVAETTANSQHTVFMPFTSVIGQTYTLSVFVKAAEYSQTLLTLGGVPQAVFDLKAGTVSSASPAYIQSLANGWYRVGLTAVATATTSNMIICPSNSIGVYTGINGNGVYMWGAEAEVGPSETSYIPTTSATATRAADLISFTNYDSPYALALYGIVLCALANAIVNYTPATSNEAQSILTQFIALFDATISPLSDLDWLSTSNSLGALRQNVLKYLQNQIAIEPAVLTQKFNDSVPDVVAAHMLFGDARRASQLVQANDPINPFYMPTSILYASS